MAKKTNGGVLAELEKAFEEDSGKGFEEVSSSDMQIPFLRIIQSLSPQVDKNEPDCIEGASVGDIFNTVTQKFWTGEEGVSVIPVYFQLKFLEFVLRKDGGGFVGELSAESDEVKHAVRDQSSGLEMLDSGNELVRTAQHYIKIIHDDGTLESAIMDPKKTQLKKSRMWLSMMSMQKLNGKTLPSFANTYRLKTVPDGNDKGKWQSWSISLEGLVPSIEAYNEAKEWKPASLNILLPPDEMVPVTDQSDEEVPF